MGSIPNKAEDFSPQRNQGSGGQNQKLFHQEAEEYKRNGLVAQGA